jgi:hypothetical protein
VRLIRLLALVMLLVAVYFAQYIFDYLSLTDLLPGWLLAQQPALARVLRWLPENLLLMAQALSLFAALGFGLITPQWQGAMPRHFIKLETVGSLQRERPQGTWRKWWVAGVLMFAALLTAVAILYGDGFVLTALWGAGAVLLLIVSWINRRYRPPAGYAPYFPALVSPYGSWPLLLALMPVVGAILFYGWPRMPRWLDPLTVVVGSALLDAQAGSGISLFSGVATGTPSGALGLSYLFTLVTGEALLGMRLAGVAAALTVVLGTWLLGCEFFRRQPVFGQYGEVIEDDGRWMALLAALVVATPVVTYAYARIPMLLEPVAVGCLCGWATLRALRTGSMGTVAVGGLLAGWGLVYGLPGVMLLAVMVLWWFGVWLLQPSWLGGHVVKLLGVAEPSVVMLQPGIGRWGVGLWWSTLLLTAAPLFAVWAQEPGGFMAYLAGMQWLPTGTNVANLAANVTALNLTQPVPASFLAISWLPDHSPVIGYPGPLLHSLMAPLAVLAIGALLANLDCVVGWFLATWIGVVALLAALFSPVAPYWPLLVVLMPALALALAFVLDRLRVLLMLDLGTWTMQATIYLALGVITAAGLLSWVGYYEYMGTRADSPSYLGWAIRELESGVTPVLVTSRPDGALLLDEVAVQLVAGPPLHGAVAFNPMQAEWPESENYGYRFLVLPDETVWLGELTQRYPDGIVQARRNLRGEPMVYYFDIPAGTVAR